MPSIEDAVNTARILSAQGASPSSSPTSAVMAPPSTNSMVPMSFPMPSLQAFYDPVRQGDRNCLVPQYRTVPPSVVPSTNITVVAAKGGGSGGVAAVESSGGSSSTIININGNKSDVALSQLTDVALSSPLSGQTLTFNGSKWVNSSVVIDATTVTYNNPDNLSYTTVDDALDYLLYIYPDVTLSGGNNFQKGHTVANVTLSWVCNKAMTTRTLSAPVPSGDRSRGAGQNGTYTHTGANLTTDTTYTLTVGDGTNTETATTSVDFYNTRFFGASAVAGPLSNAQILALSGSELATAAYNSHAYDCTGGKYIWICYPASLGTARFYVGGLETTFDLTVQAVTNSDSYVESYNCYRSLELQDDSAITVTAA
jgi:hypothetical protein